MSYLLNKKLSVFILSVEWVIFASIMAVKRVKTNFVTNQVMWSVRHVTMETNVKLTVTQPCLKTVTAQQTGNSNAVKSLWEYILMSDWFQRIFLPTCTIQHTHSLLTKGIAIEIYINIFIYTFKIHLVSKFQIFHVIQLICTMFYVSP